MVDHSFTWEEIRLCAEDPETFDRRMAQEFPEDAGRMPKGPPAKSVTAEMVTAADVPDYKIRWLLRPYLSLGTMTLLQGDPGVGKTALCCAIAAAVSTGRPLYDVPVQDPGDVVMLSCEDPVGILKGRLRENGADLNRVHLVKNAGTLGFASPAVEEMVRKCNAKLLIFDPFQAFLGEKVDMHRSNETRPILSKVADMAERLNVAVMFVAHLGKSRQDKTPVLQSLGSSDIPGAMRSIIHVCRDPDPTHENGAVLVHIKCSHARLGRSLAYCVGGQEGGIEWRGYSTYDLAALSSPGGWRAGPTVSYDDEILPKLFKELLTECKDRIFWTYRELNEQSESRFGVQAHRGVKDLREQVTRLKEPMRVKDDILVEVGAVGSHNVRGVRLTQWVHPPPLEEEPPPDETLNIFDDLPQMEETNQNME